MKFSKSVLKALIFPLALLFQTSMLFAAMPEEIHGVVSEASTGNPLAGVFVYIKGTANGTTTDINGKYALSHVEADQTIVVSLLGYKEIEMSVDGRSTIDFSMEGDADYLNEVVVIGYGTLDKKELTSAIAHVNSK